MLRKGEGKREVKGLTTLKCMEHQKKWATFGRIDDKLEGRVFFQASELFPQFSFSDIRASLYRLICCSNINPNLLISTYLFHHNKFRNCV